MRRTRRPPISVDVFRSRCFHATRTMRWQKFPMGSKRPTYSKRNCDGIWKKRVARLVHTEAEMPRKRNRTFHFSYYRPSTDDCKVAGAFTTRDQVSVGWPSLSRGKIAIRYSITRRNVACGTVWRELSYERQKERARRPRTNLRRIGSIR